MSQICLIEISQVSIDEGCTMPLDSVRTVYASRKQTSSGVVPNGTVV